MRTVPPRRVVRSYTQRLVAPPSAVLPLLCPVREADWIDGWEPLVVFTASGGAEEDCVFVTSSEPDDAVWYVTRHDAEEGFVEMIKFTPGVTACRLTIQLRPTDEGTAAEITYRHTSLGPAGDRFLRDFTEAHYQDFMQDWERRLNHYLATGSMLRDPAD